MPARHGRDRRQIDPNAVTVGWVCALAEEQTAAAAQFDEEYYLATRDDDDENWYRVGSVCGHKVAVARPIDSSDVETVESSVRAFERMFPRMRLRMSIGTGGGAPYCQPELRLGDVVVASSGLIIYQLNHEDRGSFVVRSHFKNAPGLALQAVIESLEVRKLRDSPDALGSFLADASSKLRDEYGRRPPMETDKLFCAYFPHSSTHSQCRHCNPATGIVKDRPPRDTSPLVFSGAIASSIARLARARQRDSIARRLYKDRGQLRVLCFEHHASLLVARWPCLVIRGIENYADSSDRGSSATSWKYWASLTAASYAKELLSSLPSSHNGNYTDQEVEEPCQSPIPDETRFDASHSRGSSQSREDTEPLFARCSVCKRVDRTKQGRSNIQNGVTTCYRCIVDKSAKNRPPSLLATSSSEQESDYLNQSRSSKGTTSSRTLHDWEDSPRISMKDYKKRHKHLYPEISGISRHTSRSSVNSFGGTETPRKPHSPLVNDPEFRELAAAQPFRAAQNYLKPPSRSATDLSSATAIPQVPASRKRTSIASRNPFGEAFHSHPARWTAPNLTLEEFVAMMQPDDPQILALTDDAARTVVAESPSPTAPHSTKAARAVDPTAGPSFAEIARTGVGHRTTFSIASAPVAKPQATAPSPDRRNPQAEKSARGHKPRSADHRKDPRRYRDHAHRRPPGGRGAGERPSGHSGRGSRSAGDWSSMHAQASSNKRQQDATEQKGLFDKVKTWIEDQV